MTNAKSSASLVSRKRRCFLTAASVAVLILALGATFSSSGQVLAEDPGIQSINLISPQNVTYNSADAPFNLSLSFQIAVPRIRMVSWIGYSLDGTQMVTISGNTTISVSYGPHNISVSANGTYINNPVSSEVVNFTVSIEPDLNGDGVVGIADIVLASAAYGSTPKDPNWNPRADVSDAKGIIDIFDLIRIASYYGETW